ncbi:hypothetical protein FACS189473_4330 [Spirochaetia bacterium]|nr:hypothetical protein FACS189473_4330 [Spirochaetia bacterium]
MKKGISSFLVIALIVSAMFVMVGCSKKGGGSGGNAGSGPDAAAAKGAADTVKKAAAKGGAGNAQPAAATDFVYELNEAGDGVIITGIQEDAKFGAHLVVPAEIEGFPVVVFLGKWNDRQAKDAKQPPLESVVFPDSIIFMGISFISLGSQHWVEQEYEELYPYWYRFMDAFDGSAFSGCKSLKRIVFPKKLKVIPAYVARHNPSLTAEGITWPESLEVIGDRAFYNNGFTELVIPEGVKIIGASAFAENKTLTSVTIPDSIELIGAEVFADCRELAAVKIPAHPIEYDRAVGSSDYHNGSFRNTKLGIAAQTAISDTGYQDF